jgi:hypothetical protein
VGEGDGDDICWQALYPAIDADARPTPIVGRLIDHLMWELELEYRYGKVRAIRDADVIRCQAHVPGHQSQTSLVAIFYIYII